MFLVLLTTIRKKLLNFFHVQLFVSLMALIILLCWGLPFSSMTLVGNVIFTPALTLFLLLSTLFFVTELLAIPNSFIAHALEYFCSWWSRCLHYGSPSWLLYFVQPNYPILILIVATAFVIVQLRTLTTAQQLFALALLVGSSGIYLLFLCPPPSYAARIPCNSGEVFVLHHNRQTIVIDPGVIAQNANASSWLERTLVKELAKQLGTTTIHHLIVLQPSARIFDAIEKLCMLTQVENLYLPTWQEKPKEQQPHRFLDMKHMLESTGGHLVVLNSSTIISLDYGSYLTLTPQRKRISTGCLTYPVIQVHGCVGGKNILAASSKSLAKKF